MRIILIVLLALPLLFQQCTTGNAKGRSDLVKQAYQLQLKAFSEATGSFLHCLQQQPVDKWQKAFQQTRLAYKEIEVFADYYYPSTAKAINGPPVKEVEADDLMKIIEPSGFQVMEEFLFPEIDTAAKNDLVAQARMLHSLALRLENGLASLELTDSHVFDALRLQLLRLISLGLAGGDNGIAQNSIAEAIVSLRSFAGYISTYSPDAAFTHLLNNAIAFVQKDTSFITFNRAAFISRYARPVWEELYRLQKEKNVPFLKETGLVNTASPRLFDSLFFNAMGFTGTTESSSAAFAQLGHRLFLDKRLSGDGSRSCATCHQPQKGYANNETKDQSIDGKTIIFRNTPTISYAALQPLQFADGRISFLEDQAKSVIENHSEMKGDLKKIATLLSMDTTYRNLAQKTFGNTNLKVEQITGALAAFIRSQSPFQTLFDAYLNGNEKALPAEAIKGFNLFMGKAKCGTCHFMPLFNGVVPPQFSKMESEVIGVPKFNKAPFVIDPDEGKFRFTGSPVHQFAFKTPTLRNIALTAPYMHNGVYKTLEEVIDFYDKGGAAGLHIPLSNQTLPAEPLKLSAGEKKAIIHFLHTLTDK